MVVDKSDDVSVEPSMTSQPYDNNEKSSEQRVNIKTFFILFLFCLNCLYILGIGFGFYVS